LPIEAFNSPNKLGFDARSEEEYLLSVYARSFESNDDSEVKDFKDLDVDPIVNSTWGRFGDYELVGNGKVTDPNKCGRFFGLIRTGKPMGWWWSPHFHCIGFIEDGYGRCRNCNKSTLECLSCSGFEGRTRRLFDKEAKSNGSGVGWIVKVKGERKTVRGTAWYQLNHSSFVRGSVRAKVAFWFGVVSTRKMKIEKGVQVHEDVWPYLLSFS
jgi:hypothetical protein